MKRNAVIKFFIILWAVIIETVFGLSFCGVSTAYAADIPYVKIGADVWLLDMETGRKLFLLPETYYAVIDNIDGEYYCVTFNGVSGKVLRESVSVTGYHTTAPGTVQEIKIDVKYSVFTEIKLKSTLDGRSEEYPVPTSESMFFLGKYPTDEMWYYVKYNDKCGYLKAEYTTQPNIALGTFTPLQPVTEDPEPSQVEPEEDNGNVTKILVITGVCFAVVAVLIIIFIPKKKRTGQYYYEDTES